MNLSEFEKPRSPKKESYLAERFRILQSRFPGIVQQSIITDNYIYLGMAFTGNKKRVAYFVPVKTEFKGYIGIGQKVNNEASRQKTNIVIEFGNQYYLFDPKRIVLSDHYMSEYKRTNYINFRLTLGSRITTPAQQIRQREEKPDHPVFRQIDDLFNLTEYHGEPLQAAELKIRRNELSGGAIN